MNPDEMDYEPMKRVTQCVIHRQVRSIVKAYNGEGFEDLVHTQEVLAKKKSSKREEARISSKRWHQAMNIELCHHLQPWV